MQNLTTLALSCAEKSVTIQKTQTATDISTPCLSTRVDNNLDIHCSSGPLLHAQNMTQYR